ncbi:MAG: protein kinase [Myxococcales bacterium]|nr:protein kinase [Myxococcales bacterium]
MDLDSLLSDLKDSLPSTPRPLEETHRPDWEEATLVSGEQPVPAEPQADLRLSLSPPVAVDAPADADRGDLVVVGELGKGGMGVVLLARQPSLDREVAVKVPLRTASESTVHALVREARTTGSLEHPGIVPVHALAFDSAGTPALVMKRIEGVSWATLMREAGHGAWRFVTAGRDRLEAQVQLLMQVCNAVAFAHRQGVLHRDIKPANVMVGEFGEVYLADWGVATRKPLPGEERRKGLVGTPLYFAPEMVTGDDAQMDERTDVYLLGATLYHALCGWPPHAARNLKEALAHAWAGEVRPMPQEIPAELAEVISRALARDPPQRYPSATALRDALAEFLRHRGSSRLAAAAMERLAALEAELKPANPPRERIAPLVSECRFGFLQALNEWADNPVARDGLQRCIVAAAWFEVRTGNASAARALMAELAKVPDELKTALRTLELDDEQSLVRKAHFEHLERELDPRVAIRQRIRLFLALSGVILLVTVLPSLLPVWPQLEAWLGPWLLVGKLLPASLTLLVAIVLGRRSLLGTRLNRRISWLLVFVLLAVTVNRTVGVFLGIPPEKVLILDLVVGAALSSGPALLFHWGFFISLGCNILGVIVALIWPEHVRWIYGAAAASALSGLLITWTTWRSEFTPPIDRAR